MTIEIEENSNPNVLRLFFIRHGQTNYNVNRIMQGHIDVDINEMGILQAQLVGKSLSSIKFDDFISSDLIRCVNTSKEIMVHQKCNFRTTYNLRERNMGRVEGMHVKQAIAVYGDSYRNQGEKHDELVGRLQKEFDVIVEDGIKRDFTNVALCTHGGSITTFFNHVHKQGFELDGLTRDKLRVPYNTSISVIDIDKSTGNGTIKMFGNTTHLGAELEVTDDRLR